MKWQWFDFIQLLGSIASITGVTVMGMLSPEVRGVVVVSVIVGVILTVLASIYARAQPMTKVGREAMIDTGKSVISNAKAEVIMFGGDMSWASDYEGAIRDAVDSGKKVLVIFPISVATRVVRNATLIEKAGGQLYSTPLDTGLRGVLVDSNDSENAILYLTSRRLKGNTEIEAGQRGTTALYDYVAKLYRTRRDALLIRAVQKITELTLHNSAPWKSSQNQS